MAAAAATIDDATVSREFGGTGGTVTVGKKTYAVGLRWESIQNRKKATSEAKTAAARNGADLVSVRLPDKLQYGLGSTKAGHKAGMAPLASFLAANIEGAFVCAFEVDGGHYLLAVRENQILAGYDRLVASEEEAQDVFFELLHGVGNWDQSIAPKAWNIEDTSVLHEELADVIGGKKPKSKLSPLSQRKLILQLVGTMLIIGAIGYAWNLHSQRVAAEQAAEAARVAAQLAAAAAANAAARKVPPPPMPWEGKGMGVPVMLTCIDAILAAPVAVPGWAASGVSCEDGSVSVTLRRAGGTINWIGAALNHDDFKPAVHETSSGAVVSWPIAQVKPRFPRLVDSSSTAQVSQYLVRQFEEIFQDISLKEETPAPPTGANGKTPNPDAMTYRDLAFSFVTSHDPKEYAEILAHIPALTVTSVRLDPGSWAWSIEGTIYERISPPAGNAPDPARHAP